jgi:hypothetical protein
MSSGEGIVITNEDFLLIVAPSCRDRIIRIRRAMTWNDEAITIAWNGLTAPQLPHSTLYYSGNSEPDFHLRQTGMRFSTIIGLFTNLHRFATSSVLSS